MFLRSRKGFTILELLIVISVIAILVGIALPRFKGMRDEGNVAKSKGELRSLQTAVESWRIHNADYPASLANLNATTTSPNIIGTTLPYDPFGATATTNYGYVLSTPYYVIYSVGPLGGSAPTVSNTTGNVTATNVIYVSNGNPSTGG